MASFRHLDEVRKLRPESRQRHDGVARRQRPILDAGYSPAVSSAAAEYLATITSKTTSGDYNPCKHETNPPSLVGVRILNL
jgi:hypothetical protein